MRPCARLGSLNTHTRFRFADDSRLYPVLRLFFFFFFRYRCVWFVCSLFGWYIASVDGLFYLLIPLHILLQTAIKSWTLNGTNCNSTYKPIYIHISTCTNRLIVQRIRNTGYYHGRICWTFECIYLFSIVGHVGHTAYTWSSNQIYTHHTICAVCTWCCTNMYGCLFSTMYAEGPCVFKHAAVRADDDSNDDDVYGKGIVFLSFGILLCAMQHANWFARFDSLCTLYNFADRKYTHKLYIIYKLYTMLD